MGEVLQGSATTTHAADRRRGPAAGDGPHDPDRQMLPDLDPDRLRADLLALT